MLLRHFLFLTFVATCFALPQTLSPRQANSSTDAAPGTDSEETSPFGDTKSGVTSSESPVDEDEPEQHGTNTAPASPKTPTEDAQTPATEELGDGEDGDPSTPATEPGVTPPAGDGQESETPKQPETGSSTDKQSGTTSAEETSAGGSEKASGTSGTPATVPEAPPTNSTHPPTTPPSPDPQLNSTQTPPESVPSAQEDSQASCTLPCEEQPESYTNTTTGSYCSACQTLFSGRQHRNAWNDRYACASGEPEKDIGQGSLKLCWEQGDEPVSFSCYDSCSQIMGFGDHCSTEDFAAYNRCIVCDNGRPPSQLNAMQLADWAERYQAYCSSSGWCIDISTGLRTVNEKCPQRDDPSDCTLTCLAHPESYTNSTTRGHCSRCVPGNDGELVRNTWAAGFDCPSGQKTPDKGADGRPGICRGIGYPPASLVCYDSCNAVLQLSKVADPCTENAQSTFNACEACPYGTGFAPVGAFRSDLTAWCREKRCFDIETGQRITGPNCPAVDSNSGDSSPGTSNPGEGNTEPSTDITRTPSAGGDGAKSGSSGGSEGATGSDGSKSGSRVDDGAAAAPTGNAASAGTLRGSTVISAGRAVATVINDQNGVALSQVIAVSTTDGSGRPTLELFTQALVGGTFTPNTRLGSSPPTATSSPSGSPAAVRLNQAMGTFSLALSLIVLRLV